MAVSFVMNPPQEIVTEAIRITKQNIRILAKNGQ